MKGSWSVSENNRRARYYALTAAGRRRLTTQQKAWERTAAAMLRVLGTATVMRALWRRLRELLTPQQLDRESIDEMTHHVEMVAARQDSRRSR